MDQIRTGAFIASMRKAKGLTQEEMASALRVSQKTISRWETGRNMPDLSMIPEVCEFLDISIEEFVAGEKRTGEAAGTNDGIALKELISLIGRGKSLKGIAGAIISFILMLLLMFGLYNMEFSVRIDSTSALEAAIDKYNFADDLESDVLESERLGNRLFILYGQKNHQGASGFATLEKGILGKYRLLHCSNTSYPLVSSYYAEAEGKRYLVTCCINDLTEVSAYSVSGWLSPEELTQKKSDNNTGNELFRLKYEGSPFMTFTEIDKDVTISPFPEGRDYYDVNGDVINREQLESGISVDEGAVISGTDTAELWLTYLYEAIILVLGIIVIRYFLSDNN